MKIVIWKAHFVIDKALMKLLYRFVRRPINNMVQQAYLTGLNKGWLLHDQYLKAMIEQRAISLSRNPIDKEINEIMAREGL